MNDQISTVLLAGMTRGPFEAIAPVLDRRHLEIEHVIVPDEAVALAGARPFDLVIFDAELEWFTLADLVGRLRSSASASRECSLLVVAEPGAAMWVRELIGRGVNRVVTLDMSEEVIDQHVADLLNVAPRAAVRISARLTTVLDTGTIEVVGRTVNLSVTGMLLQTATLLDVGQRVDFEFLTTNRDDMVSGEAVVVRHAVAEKGGVNGIGLRFVALDEAGRNRIEGLLTESCVVL